MLGGPGAVDVDGAARHWRRTPRPTRIVDAELGRRQTADQSAERDGGNAGRPGRCWHVRAEAQRQVRSTGVPANGAIPGGAARRLRCCTLVDLVALAAPHDGIEEPGGVTTGRRVRGLHRRRCRPLHLAADPRRRGPTRRDGRTSRRVSRRPGARSTWPCSKWRRTGLQLDAGQAVLVRPMCTSGARLQLAIAPGRRRENHRHACPHPGLDARRRPGGRPGPVGCRGRRSASTPGIRADTLAKLTWSIRHGELPDWAAAHRPVDAGDHRRGRHGRHPLPRRGRAVRHRSRWQCPTDR